MKVMIKKFFLISILLISANFCLAAENVEVFMCNDYLVTSDEKVKAILVANPAIVSLNPFFTIFNEKNVVFLHPQRVGKSAVTFCLEGSEVVLNVIVKANKNKKDIEALNVGGFEIMPLDAPPTMHQLPTLEDVEDLDAPPAILYREGA